MGFFQLACFKKGSLRVPFFIFGHSPKLKKLQQGLQQASRIAIVGNVGGGKTRLARQLAKGLSLPLTHVDSIQFLPGLKMRPFKESIEILRAVQEQSSWIIDGYGPLDILIQRFELADRIIFIDFPLWRHQWWFLKRQMQVLLFPRKELPERCFEFSWKHTLRVWRGIRSEYRQMRPELLRIFTREDLKEKVVWVRTPADWRRVAQVSSSVS